MLNQDCKKLELDKILQRLSDNCSNNMSKKKALDITPKNDFMDVKAELEKTTDAFEMAMAYGSPSFYNFKDVKSSLARCASGGRVSLRELLNIKQVLNQIQIISDWYSHLETKRTSLDYLFTNIMPIPNLLSSLERSILEDETISDSASSALLSIRQKIARSGIKLRETLNNMVKNPDVQKYLQDTNITLRDGRYVLPVKAEFRSQIKGLVHDTSATGATIFIEPIAVVDANNDIRLLEAREQEEIERIITELCSECGTYSETIMLSQDALCELNLYFAKADLGIKMKAFPAKINYDGIFNLKKARHPLLDPKTAVPVDIKLGEDYNMLIITGPNTGGKTVSLKTLGLLTAMTECGLMIPAEEGSEIRIVDDILTDIGDKQSIEANLSTFSSHMTAIAEILKKATKNSLVLLDEPGTGTDPVEGAALAESIFESLRQRHTFVMATTHYQELKIYASQMTGVENASCEFDPETLKPTYRLRVGAPGKSNAFFIAENLGISQDIIDYAKSVISSENKKFENVIAKLEDTQRELEKERETAENDRKRIEEIKINLEISEKEIEKNKKNEMERARGIAQQIIDKTTAQSNALIDELENLRKEKEKEDFAKNVSNAKSNARSALDKMYDGANPLEETSDEKYVLPRPLKQGDNVYIPSLGKSGIIAGNPEKGDKVFVQVGIMKMKLDIKSLRLEEKKKQQAANNKPKRRVSNAIAKNVKRSGSMELDIRGMASDEGVYEMEAFIDRAVISGLSVVTIIHGKGTGVLRDACRRKLRSISSVKSFRPGVYGEGEDGVTVVELK